jgi:hypothetical protein
MFILPNNQILTVNNANKSYNLYDENYKKVKDIKRIGEHKDLVH